MVNDMDVLEGRPYTDLLKSGWRDIYAALTKENKRAFWKKYIKIYVHYFRAEGKPEFTGATEENQLCALSEYLKKEMKNAKN